MLTKHDSTRLDFTFERPLADMPDFPDVHIPTTRRR